MSDTAEFLVYILNCFINGKNLKKNGIGDIDWEELLHLSKIHCVQGIVWAVLKKNDTDNIPHKIAKDFNSAFMTTINNSIKQEIALEKIKNKLNECGVKHVMMKGSVIKDYYPAKELRTMGDIDYLITEESRDLCHKAMTELGYELKVHGASVWEYSGDLAYVEVHTKIIYQKLFLGIDFTKYFSDVFDNLVLVEKNTFEMTPEYHFIYIVVHLSKHLYKVGCGVRMVMDIPVFINHFGKELDWNILESKFEEIGLWGFVKNLMYLCVKYFDCALPNGLYNKDDSIAENLMEYILSAGVFGKYNRNEFDVKYSIDNANKKGIGRLTGKADTVRKIAFPDYETMCNTCGWFKGKPKYMLPWGWIKRLYLNVRYKKDLIKDKLSGALSESNERKKHYEVMSMIGLIKRKEE